MMTENRIFLWVTLFAFLIFRVSCEDAPTINIALVYTDPFIIKRFDLAIDYLKQDSASKVKVGSVYKIQSNGTAATKLIQSICKDVNEIFSKSDGERPDIIIDLTPYGIPSEVIKIISKVMNIPTISGSFGHQEELRSWRGLSQTMKQYLIQIAPPSNNLAQAMRSVIIFQNYSSGSFLPTFDYEYGMSVKVKVSNPANPKFVVKINRLTDYKYINQFTIDQHAHGKLSNFFASGSHERLTQVLEIATDPGMRDGPYNNKSFAWHFVSLDITSPTCTKCQGDISLIHLSPKLPTTSNKRWKFVESNSFRVETITDLFYIDLVASSVLAVGKMKQDGNWIAPPKRICSETTTINDDYYLDLFNVLKSDDILEQNMLGKFHMDPDMIQGKSHALYEMDVNLLKFKAKQAHPESKVVLGTWRAGLEGEAVLESEGHQPEWDGHKGV